MHFYQLLSELRIDCAPEKLEETIAFIRQDLIHSIVEGEIDGLTVQVLLNDQQDTFFEALATEFVTDLNRQPFAYFSLWEPLLAYLDRGALQLFYTAALQQAGATEAYACCSGFWELENSRPIEAMVHFHNVTNDVRSYGIGRCYQELGHFESALWQYNIFLNIVMDSWQPDDKEQQIKMAEWHYYKEASYCCFQLGAWESADTNFYMTFGLFPIESLYNLSIGRTGNKANIFHLLVGQYLQVLEKANNKEMAIEVIECARHLFPADAYYKMVDQRLKAATDQQDMAGQLLARLFQPALPTYLLPATTTPALKSTLKQVVQEQLLTGYVFNKQLSLYDTDECYGQEYYVAEAACIVDFILEEAKTQRLYAVMGATSEEALNTAQQLEHCCEALAVELNKEVKGILCVYGKGSIDRESRAGINNCEVFKMSHSFSQLPSKQ